MMTDVIYFIKSAVNTLLTFSTCGLVTIILYKEFHSLPLAIAPFNGEEAIVEAKDVLATIDKLEAITEGLDEANRYQVRLTWESKNSPSSWIVEREDAGSSHKDLTVLDRNKREYVDTAVEAGRYYQYELIANHRGVKTVRRTVGVRIPKDIAIHRTTDLHGAIRANRIFINSTGKIRSQGKDLEIKVNEIISDLGIIESFGPNQTAKVGKDGRSGGEIRISAKKGKGHLFINARGENGGAGLAGKVGQEGAKGEDGENAELRIRDGAINVHSMNSKEDAQNLFKCKIEPSDGKRGENGDHGESGGKGGRGGDSPLLLVDIKEAHEIKVEHFITPGVGGKGGLGGAGGKAGGGGKAGQRDSLSLCREPTGGFAGNDGAKGLEGDKGEDGKEGPICIRLSGHPSPGCRASIFRPTK